MLRDYVGIEGGFRDNTRPSSLQLQTSKLKYEGRDLVCFRCNVSGHKASDCPSKYGNRPSGNSREWNGTKDHRKSRVVCYSCQKEGYKLPECPYKKTIVRKIKKEAEPKPIKKNANKDHILKGKVNDMEIDFLLDTGAGITLVPRSRVPEEEINEKDLEHVQLYCAKQPFRLPTAMMEFKMYGTREW